MIKVSIITVCYNSAATIRRTIESVLRQTYQNIEYIIVDGASKDETLSIIEEYRDALGQRLRLVSEPDQGIYDAMNKGIRMAEGTLIGILNSDDFYEPMAVEHIVNAMTDEKYQILYENPIHNFPFLENYLEEWTGIFGRKTFLQIFERTDV